MNSFFSRIKKWRLRWKIAPVVLILGFVLFCLIAKRPPLKVELTRVLQHGDWLRIECVVTNVSSFNHGLTYDIESDTINTELLYQDEFPNQMDNWVVLQSDFPEYTWDSEIVSLTLFPGEQREMMGYLHAEHGMNRFVPTVSYSGRDSPHWKFSQWMQKVESEMKFGHPLFRKIERIIYFCFYPQEIRGEEFVPANEVSGRLGKSIEERIDELLDKKLTPRLKFLETNNGYLNLQSLSKSPETFVWQNEESEGRWKSELDWRLAIGGSLSARDDEKEEAKVAEEEWYIDPAQAHKDAYIREWKEDRKILREFYSLAECIQKREEERRNNITRNHYMKLLKQGELPEMGIRDSWREFEVHTD